MSASVGLRSLMTTTNKGVTREDVEAALDVLFGITPERKSLIRWALMQGGVMSLRRWMTSREPKFVDTLQVVFNSVGKAKSAWWPGRRKVDATATSFVELGGSRRDYRGVRCLAAIENECWVGFDDEGVLLIYF